jgi:hypothetical protein
VQKFQKFPKYFYLQEFALSYCPLWLTSHCSLGKHLGSFLSGTRRLKKKEVSDSEWLQMQRFGFAGNALG